MNCCNLPEKYFGWMGTKLHGSMGISILGLGVEALQIKEGGGEDLNLVLLVRLHTSNAWFPANRLCSGTKV